MGIFSFLNKSSVIKSTDKEFFYPIRDGLSVFGEQTPLLNLKYFLDVPELNNLITTKARMFSNMDLAVKSKKTGLDLPLTSPLQKVLQQPNWWQSQKELIIQNKIYSSIHGNDYLFFLKPLGFSKGSIKQMSSLNPLFLKPKQNQLSDVPNFMAVNPNHSGWYYNYKNKQISIEYDDVLHSNNNNVETNEDIGISPLRSLRPNLDNIISAYEARGKNLRSHGAIGILSNDSKDGIGAVAPLRDEPKEQLQKDLQRYGIAKGQWSHIITNLSLKWQKMGGNVKDLMLFEEIEADFQALCGQFGLARELFPTVKGSTFDNQKEAQKQTYINTIIPEAQEFVNGLNKYFETENKSYIITAEYKHLPIFDEDKKERAQSILLTTNALSKAFIDGAITLEQYQIELNKFGI